MNAILAHDNVYFLNCASENIGFACLYDEKYQDRHSGKIVYIYNCVESWEYVGSLTSTELSDICATVAQDTGAFSLDWNSSMGKTLLTVKKPDVYKIESIIQTFLNNGFRLYMNDGSQLTLSPENMPNYSWRAREQLLLKNYTHYRSLSYWSALKDTISFEWKMGERVRLPELKAFMLAEFPEANTKENEKDSTAWKNILQENDKGKHKNNIDGETLNESEGNVERHDEAPEHEIEEDGKCIICFENEAETLLEKCGHIVVCEKCSDELNRSKNSEMRDKCIYCKQDIDQITYIKSLKVLRKKAII